jgi:hypothetical protein
MTTDPRRIQLSRRAGWRKPADAIVVSRPTRFGNPFTANGDRAEAVARYREWLETPHHGYTMIRNGHRYVRPTPDDLEALRGHDLACWCPLDQPCHADVLLEIANGKTTP